MGSIANAGGLRHKAMFCRSILQRVEKPLAKLIRRRDTLSLAYILSWAKQQENRLSCREGGINHQQKAKKKAHMASVGNGRRPQHGV
jgi:hypothetical protein